LSIFTSALHFLIGINWNQLEQNEVRGIRHHFSHLHIHCLRAWRQRHHQTTAMVVGSQKKNNLVKIPNEKH
jgi:hypothetical protein